MGPGLHRAGVVSVPRRYEVVVYDAEEQREMSVYGAHDDHLADVIDTALQTRDRYDDASPDEGLYMVVVRAG